MTIWPFDKTAAEKAAESEAEDREAAEDKRVQDEQIELAAKTKAETLADWRTIEGLDRRSLVVAQQIDDLVMRGGITHAILLERLHLIIAHTVYEALHGESEDSQI
jgi:hypothetical protein